MLGVGEGYLGTVPLFLSQENRSGSGEGSNRYIPGWRRDILETMAVLHGEQKIAEGPEMEIHDPAEGRKHCTENPVYVFLKKKV